jgi:hypothetical protein
MEWIGIPMVMEVELYFNYLLLVLLEICTSLWTGLQ